MFTFDAFAFVQCTLIFFVIAALGLRARTLLEVNPPPPPMLTQLSADARTMAKGAVENVGGAFLAPLEGSPYP